MMKIVVLLLSLVALSQAFSSYFYARDTRVRYDNYAVYKVYFRNELQRVIYENLAKFRENFNVWHTGKNEMHIMVNPTHLMSFRKMSQRAKINFELLIPNVQSLIDQERAANTFLNRYTFDWDRYHTLPEIEAWLDRILEAHPNVTENLNIGKSYEGRTIRGIKISYKAGNPGIFIESNIHAREWITSATATWLINELLTSSDEKVREIAENVDWYIVPVLNVDGFVFTHEKDRMWRKTRRPVNISDCIGADPNRNFDTHWLENGGASANPCSENYAGQAPFSEPEIKALADYIASNKEKFNVLLAFHSYSQLVLTPYGHTATEFPKNYNDMLAIGKAFADAVEVLPYKTDYIYGSAASVLYLASGSTVDWAYNEQNINLTYTIELRDTGRYGFVLPPLQIKPNCEEALAGIIALVKKATELHYMDPRP